MMRPALFAATLFAATSLAASAGLAEDLLPLDLAEVDPAMIDGTFGEWVITDESGARTCKVNLHEEATIGGRAIDVDPACATVFPVMDNVAAWQLMQNWTIDLIDATRHRVLRFSTPGESYLAEEEVDGIFTITKP